MAMPRRKSSTLTECELEIMHVVWDKGAVTADDVRKGLFNTRPLSDSAVRTMLKILERKKYLRHRLEGRTFVYRTTDGKDNVLSAILRRVRDKVFGGSYEVLAKHLLTREKLSREELNEIKKLVLEREQQTTRRTGCGNESHISGDFQLPD
jgi:predicted transcriptional regulator